MTRARYAVAAILVGALASSGSALSAQTQSTTPPAQPKAPEMKSVLAGKKFVPPIKGEAKVDFVKIPTKREGSTLVTKIQVKNMSEAPIPRLTIDETWYDKNNNLIPGGKGVINGLLQPGEVQTIEIRTPVNPNMQTSMLQFSHANGAVKTHPVKSFDGTASEPVPKTAAKSKKK